MVALYLSNEGTNAAWRVWPDPEAIEPGAIQETKTYLFELRDSAGADTADLLIDDIRLEALRTQIPGRARWRWSPGFHAGIVDAEIRLSGHAPRRFRVTTDPDKRKLTRSDFDTMIKEVLDDTFALFSLSSFRKGVARGIGNRPPAIARLEFLRSRIEQLEVVVASIERRPRRRLAAKDVVLPYHRANRATGLEVLRSFRSGRVVHELESGRLPPLLKGALPQKIRVRKHHSSLDIPEHRQMSACLRSWAEWMDSAADQLERICFARGAEDQVPAVTWALRCRGLARRIRKLNKAEPFADAAPSSPHLLISALFRNDPTYRAFYRLWQDINLGVAAIFGDFLNLPLARTFEIYELWCFLRLVRAAVHEYGAPVLSVQDLFVSDAAGGITFAAGSVTVPVGSEWKICFQKQYREFWQEPSGQGSYSRTMTPDIVVAHEASIDGPKSKLIVLDAKYRIENGLSEALNSIHTYRDALVREASSGAVEGVVTAAYLLTPFMPMLDATYRETKMPGRLFHPDYRAGFRFGAVTLRPGMTLAEVGDVVQRIVADATG